MTIPSYRLPPWIEKGSRFGPAFKNIIQEAISGNEQRICQWTKCRCTGDVSYGLNNSSNRNGDFHAILALWRAHFGSFYPFRFRDWSDYTTSNEVFGTGNGSTKDFQLSILYDPAYKLLGVSGTLLYLRSITLPNDDVVIKVDGVTQTLTTHYTISSGVVSFVTAPASGKAISWSGTFDVPVRFDTDQFPTIMNEDDIISIGSLPIREVIGEA